MATKHMCTSLNIGVGGHAHNRKETSQPATKDTVSIPCRDLKTAISLVCDFLLLANEDTSHNVFPPSTPHFKVGQRCVLHFSFAKSGPFFIPPRNTLEPVNNFDVGGKGGQCLATAFPYK